MKKILLILFAVLIGFPAVAAEPTVLYERTADTWSEADLSEWVNDNAEHVTQAINGGLKMTGTNYGWNSVKGITFTENSIVTLTATLTSGGASGRSGSYDFLKLGNAEVRCKEQDKKASIVIGDTETQLMGYTRNGDYNIEMSLNQATQEVIVKVSGGAKGEATGKLTGDLANNVVVGHYRAGRENYEVNEVLKAITIKEEVQAVATYDYTIKYTYESEIIKTEEGSTVADAVVTADNTFTVDDQKYYVAEGATTSMTISAEGGNILNVAMRKAYVYNYTVANNVNDETSTGTCVEGESVTVPYNRYILKDGTVWMKDATSQQYAISFIPNADNFTETLNYAETESTDAIYFAEGEKIEGMTYDDSSNAKIRCSNQAGGYAEAAVTVCTLDPGTYKVKLGVWGNAGTDFVVKAGDETVLTTKTRGYWLEAPFKSKNGDDDDPMNGEFTLYQKTPITFEGASKGKVLDYILITGTPVSSATLAAYEAVVAKIQKAENDYNEAVEKAGNDYPGADLSEWTGDISNAISTAKQGAYDDFVKAVDNKTDFEYSFDYEEIKTAIADMQATLKLRSDNQKAYEAVLAQINAAEAAYKAALDEVAENYPDYDLTEWTEIFEGAINNEETGAKPGALKALALANEDGEEYFFPFDAEPIEGTIATMKLYAANDAACKAVLAEIGGVEADYLAAVDAIKDFVPDFDPSKYDIKDQIDKAKTDAEQALAEADDNFKNYAEVYSFDADEIESSIKDMKNSHRDAYNKGMYNNVMANIEDVEKEYNDAVATIKKRVPGFDLKGRDWTNIGTQIADQKKAAATALKTANDEEDLFEYTFTDDAVAEYKGMIAMMKQDANQFAYDAVVETIDGLQKEYDEAIALIAQVNPGIKVLPEPDEDLTEEKIKETSEYKYAELTQIIPNAISEAKEGAEQQLDSANEDNDVFNFAYTGEDVEAMIAELKKIGLADPNQKAYKQTLAVINGLLADYQDALYDIEDINPDFDSKPWASKIEKPLENAKNAAKRAYDSADEAGELYEYEFDPATYESLIAEMKASAGISGIEGIEAEVAAGKAKIFTLDGKSHNAPVKGQVNVIVRGSSVVKTMISK